MAKPRIKLNVPLEQKYKFTRNDVNAAGRVAIKHIKQSVARGKTGTNRSMGQYTKRYAKTRSEANLQTIVVDMSFTGKMLKDLGYKRYTNLKGFSLIFKTRKSEQKYIYQKSHRKFLKISKKAEKEILKMLVKRLSKR